MIYPQFRIVLDQYNGWKVMQKDYEGAIPYFVLLAPTLEDAMRQLSFHVGGRGIAIKVSVQP